MGVFKIMSTIAWILVISLSDYTKPINIKFRTEKECVVAMGNMFYDNKRILPNNRVNIFPSVIKSSKCIPVLDKDYR
jgi:hypothetical protein